MIPVAWSADLPPIELPCVVDGMPDDVYHADATAAGSLSSSGARDILRSPALFAYRRTHRVEKTTYDVGHAAHAKILGVGMDVIEYPAEHLTPSGNVSTKAPATAWASEQRALGLIPVTPEWLVDVKAMAEAVLAHPLARALLEKPGAPEQSAFAQDPATGVWLRARVDRLAEQDEGRTILVDLKTARSADPRLFRNGAAEHGYAIQDDFYRRVVSLARGDEDPAFVFIVVESTAPYLVSVIQLDDEFAAIGHAKTRRAIDLYHLCTTSDRWPGYPTTVHRVEPPRWYTYEHEEQSA